MADKNWKRAERRAAARLGGRRIPVTGERNGADVIAPRIAAQIKYSRRRPAFLAEWLDGIVANAATTSRFGLVVWVDVRERIDDAIVLVRLGDFARLTDSTDGPADR